MTVAEQIYKKETEIAQLTEELDHIFTASSFANSGYIRVGLSKKEEKRRNLECSKKAHSLQNKITTREKALQKLYERRANGEI